MFSFHANVLTLTRNEQCCNATITWQILLSIPRGEVGRTKKDLSWTCHAFQPRNLWRLVFAVSLKFLISVDFLSNVPSHTDWHKAWIFALARDGMHQGEGWCGPKKNVNRILLRQADTASLGPRDKTGAAQKTTSYNTHSSEWSVNAASRVPVPSLRRWGIFMECVLTIRRFTTDMWPEATVLAESWGSYSWLPIITGSA